MNKIIDLQNKKDSKTNWETSNVICEHCIYPHTSVHPLGLDKVECPSCGNMTKIDIDTFELFFTYLNIIKNSEELEKQE